MRYTRYIFIHLVCALSFVLHGCIKEELDAIGSDNLQTTLTVDVVSHAATTRAGNTSPLVEDYSIERLRIFALDDNGIIENNEFVDNITSSSSSGFYHSFNVTKSPKKKLYVVVNEPTSLTEKLSKIKYQSELAMLNYQIAEALNNEAYIAGGSIEDANKRLPMSAVTVVNANNDDKIVVKVDRVVARVDIMVDKDEVANTQNVEFNSSTSVSVNGLYYNTSLFEPFSVPAPSSSQLVNINSVALKNTTKVKLKDDSRESATRILSFYMAERTYNINPSNPSENRIAINIDNITVDDKIKNIKSTILLGNNVVPYITEINRNYVYKIFATYKGVKETIEVTDEYAIDDWTVEHIDGDIEGVMMVMENQVVMDWIGLNNSFTTKDISFGSNRTVEIYVPTAYDEAADKYSFEKCNFIAQDGISYDLLDLSLFGIANEDNYLRSLPWLTNATITYDSPLTGYFKFTYTLGTTPSAQDKVAIRVVSANVHKQLKILYDNGYVPGDLLQANDVAGCWGDAPNGIAFAKRGDALHPKITEDILLPNSAGYYEGDIAVTADKADKYCKDKLGPRWYAPNKDQLTDIKRHVLELGTSYRYNNAPNSNYWSSEEQNSGNYWYVNFGKDIADAVAASAPSTNSYYTRCITNL